MALARWLPDKTGKLAANTYQTWNEIDPKLPNQPITIYGRARYLERAMLSAKWF